MLTSTVHLPALQVVIPLIGAPVCALVRGPRLAWLLATIVSAVALVISIALLDRVLSGGTIVYALGGWAAPWGIEYRVDELNAFVLLIVSAISTAVLPFARRSVEREVDEDRVYLFYTCWMLMLTGLLGIAITGDAFNVFVFLEISSLSSYILIALSRDRRALTAAFRYLVMGTIGATFLLIGIGILYGMTGTLNMSDLAARIPEVESTRAVKLAFAFVVIGLGLKVAIFPLHAWLPDAYAYAPSTASAFLAGTATKVAIYALVRFIYSVFGAGFAFDIMAFDIPLLGLGLAAVVSMSLVAIYQDDTKRMLAYSSVAQIGYVSIAIALASVVGLTAGVVHLFNHALIKGALFLALGCVFYRTGSVNIASMAGLGWRMPWTMAAFTLGSLSLVGVPLTAGFISKWYLLLGAIERGWWPVAVLIVLASVLAAVYTGRIIEAAYFGHPAADAVQARVSEAPLEMLVPVWMLVAANVYFGIRTDLTLGAAGQAANALLGGAP